MFYLIDHKVSKDGNIEAYSPGFFPLWNLAFQSAREITGNDSWHLRRNGEVAPMNIDIAEAMFMVSEHGYKLIVGDINSHCIQIHWGQKKLDNPYSKQTGENGMNEITLIIANLANTAIFSTVKNTEEAKKFIKDYYIDEYEVQLLDGPDWAIKAVERSFGFEKIFELNDQIFDQPDPEAAEALIYWLIAHKGANPGEIDEDIFDKYMICKQTGEEYMADYMDGIGDIPEYVEGYIDFAAMARDYEFNGDLATFRYNLEDYVIPNPNNS